MADAAYNKLTPHFQLLLDGTPAPLDLAASVIGIRIAEDLTRPSRFTLHISDVGRVWTKSAKFKTGREIEVKLGYLAKLESLIKAEVHTWKVDLAAEGPARLTIVGYDRLHRFTRSPKTRTFTNQKDSDIARTITQEHGLSAEVDDSQALRPFVLQNNVSDFDFLLERAALCGFDLSVEAKKLRFKRPGVTSPAVATLVWGENVGRLAHEINTFDQAPKLEVRAWDPVNRKALTAPAKTGDEQSKMGGQTVGAKLAKDRFGDSQQIVLSAATSLKELELVGKAEFNRRAGAFVQLEGRVNGDPKIRAGSVVEVQKAGKRLDGIYYVTASEHIFYTDSGYATEFQARRYTMDRGSAGERPSDLAKSSPVVRALAAAKTAVNAAKNGVEAARQGIQAAKETVAKAKKTLEDAQKALNNAVSAAKTAKEAVQNAVSGAQEVAATLKAAADQAVTTAKAAIESAKAAMATAKEKAAKAADAAAASGDQQEQVAAALDAATMAADVAGGGLESAQDVIAGAADVVEQVVAAVDAIAAGEEIQGSPEALAESLAAAADGAAEAGEAAVAANETSLEAVAKADEAVAQADAGDVEGAAASTSEGAAQGEAAAAQAETASAQVAAASESAVASGEAAGTAPAKAAKPEAKSEAKPAPAAEAGAEAKPAKSEPAAAAKAEAPAAPKAPKVPAADAAKAAAPKAPPTPADAAAAAKAGVPKAAAPDALASAAAAAGGAKAPDTKAANDLLKQAKEQQGGAAGAQSVDPGALTQGADVAAGLAGSAGKAADAVAGVAELGEQGAAAQHAANEAPGGRRDVEAGQAGATAIAGAVAVGATAAVTADLVTGGAGAAEGVAAAGEAVDARLKPPAIPKVPSGAPTTVQDAVSASELDMPLDEESGGLADDLADSAGAAAKKAARGGGMAAARAGVKELRQSGDVGAAAEKAAEAAKKGATKGAERQLRADAGSAIKGDGSDDGLEIPGLSAGTVREARSGLAGAVRTGQTAPGQIAAGVLPTGELRELKGDAAHAKFLAENADALAGSEAKGAVLRATGARELQSDVSQAKFLAENADTLAQSQAKGAVLEATGARGIQSDVSQAKFMAENADTLAQSQAKGAAIEASGIREIQGEIRGAQSEATLLANTPSNEISQLRGEARYAEMRADRLKSGDLTEIRQTVRQADQLSDELPIDSAGTGDELPLADLTDPVKGGGGDGTA